MGRLFSVLFLSAVMLLPVQRTQRAYEQPAFFSMLFPQLVPQWMLGEDAREVQL